MPVRSALVATAVLAAVLLGVAPHNAPTTEAAGPGTWSPAADMPFGRLDHASTLLPNGKVLVTGGGGVTSGGASLPYNWETAIYTRATNSWTQTANMLYARVFHQATLLRDGRVLVTGGWNHAQNATLNEIYTPSSNTWTAAPPMNRPRIAHTATLLPDGRVLVTGGSGTSDLQIDASSDSAEIYDPIANTWTNVPNMNSAKFDHGATLLPDGRVLVVGWSSSAELYDVGTNTWTATPATGLGAILIEQIRGVLMPDGRALFVGGNSASVYEPASGTWTFASPPPVQTVGFTLNLLGNGKVMITNSYGSTTYLFNHQTMSWELTGSMSRTRTFAATTLLATGELLVAGGGYAVASTELYDPTAWVPVASIPTPRSVHTATLLWNGRVLVAGGGSADASAYDETTDSWTAAGTMSAPRANHSAARLNDGRVLVVGGTDGPNTGTNQLLTAEIYSPSTNSWATVASPSLAHVGSSAVVVPDGRVVVYGGAVSGDIEIYSPSTNSWALGTPNSYVGQSAGQAIGTSTGRVLAIDAEGAAALYDPISDTWTQSTHTAAFFPGPATQLEGSSKIIVSGGRTLQPPAQTPTTTIVAIFDAATEAWTAAANLPSARSAHTATGLYGGNLLAAGGVQTMPGLPPTDVALATVVLYDAAANTWTSAGDMSTARRSHTATRLMSGNVLVVGGRNASGVVPTAEMYDLGIHTDTDGDGYNDGLELALGQHPWLNCKTMRADVSGDGVVNVADLGRVASHFGKRPPPARIDQNGDTVINVADLGLTASQSGKSVLMCP